MIMVSRPRASRRGIAVLLVCPFLLAPAALGSQVRPLNLEEMTARAARIFIGRCTAVTNVEDPVSGGPVQLATFTVAQSLKGRPDESVTVKVDAGRIAPGPRGAEPAGAPAFRPGEQVVLFLYGESALGFSSAVGLGQGKFTVLADGKGGTIAVNSFGNDHLLDNLSAEAKSRLGPGLAAWKNRRAIDVGALVSMVGKLLDVANGHGTVPGQAAQKGGRP